MTTGARRGWFGLGLGVAATAAALAAAAGGWRRPDPRPLLEHAQADYQAGRYGRAESGLAQLARLRDPTPMDRMARALVAEALGRGDDALAELARIGGDDPLSPLAELLAGRIERNRANLRRAEGHFLAALGRDPTLAQARNELAYIYNVQLRLDEMDAQMDALSRLDALGFDSLLHWSKTRNVTWNSASDCETLARSVAADPGDRRSRLALADGLRQLGRRAEADAILAPLPASDPEACARRSWLAMDGGDHARAERWLSGGPEDHAGLAKIRGLLALRRRDPRESARHLRMAMVADPDDRAVLSALATASRLLGDESGARSYLDAVRHHDDLTPLIAYAATLKGKSDPTLPARMGAACEAAGRPAEARAWYRLAIARDPLDAAAQQAAFRLNRGEPPLSASSTARSASAGRAQAALETPTHLGR